jgi:DNA-binding CsgD family transcriptional regulator
VIARPDPDPRDTRAAETAPAPGRSWRLIAGGTAPATPNRRPVEAAFHLLAEHLEQGLAVTDRSGRAQFLNRTARAFVGRGLLRLERGCLRGPTPEAGAALRRILADCTADRGGATRLDGEGGTLLVAACAIPGASDPAGAVLLRLIDPADAPLPDPDALRTQFGFTPAESALALDILAGNDLAASARRRGITRNTARVHLRRLFEKTGTRRQAELLRLLLLCPQPLAPAGDDSKIFALELISSPNGGCTQEKIRRR